MNKETNQKSGLQKSIFITKEANEIINNIMLKTNLSYSELVSLSIETLNYDLIELSKQRKLKKLTRKDKIKIAVNKSFSKGQIVCTKEIIEAVKKFFPEIPNSSILPSDFCSNHNNLDPFSGKYHIFSKIKDANGQYIRGQYTVL